MRELRWTKRLRRALQMVEALERAYVPGRDPTMPIDVAKVELADALLRAIAARDRGRFPARLTPARASLREQGVRHRKKA